MQLVVASKSRWLGTFGQDGTNAIAAALGRYCDTLRARKGVDVSVVFPDDAASVSAYGVGAAASSDGYAMGQVLWKVFAAPGREITSVLLLGGTDLFPIIGIDNPVRQLRGFPADKDTQILTDNHYGGSSDVLRDLLAPARAIGRLLPAGGKDSDLIAALDGLSSLHTKRPLRQGNLAVSTVLWEKETAMVVGPLGAEIRLAPDYQLTAAAVSPDLKKQNLHFNLHGFANDGKWVGENAFRTAGCVVPGSFNNRSVEGAVIFAENCYGAYLPGKSQENSCACKLAAEGAASFVGSTTYAWGRTSLDPMGMPANADLLASLFWSSIREGKRAGFALRDAKQQFLRQALSGSRVNELQYKTLFQFLLIGDPLL